MNYSSLRINIVCSKVSKAQLLCYLCVCACVPLHWTQRAALLLREHIHCGLLIHFSQLNIYRGIFFDPLEYSWINLLPISCCWEISCQYLMWFVIFCWNFTQTQGVRQKINFSIGICLSLFFEQCYMPSLVVVLVFPPQFSQVDWLHIAFKSCLLSWEFSAIHGGSGLP